MKGGCIGFAVSVWIGRGEIAANVGKAHFLEIALVKFLQVQDDFHGDEGIGAYIGQYSWVSIRIDLLQVIGGKNLEWSIGYPKFFLVNKRIVLQIFRIQDKLIPIGSTGSFIAAKGPFGVS